MREIRDDVRWLARDDRVALATVVATRRSAPRPVGAKLAISVQASAGSVSGGCVKDEVSSTRRKCRRASRLLTYGISDDLALSVGLPAAARSTSSWRKRGVRSPNG